MVGDAVGVKMEENQIEALTKDVQLKRATRVNLTV